MPSKLTAWVRDGITIAGAGLAPVAAASLGDPTGGALMQFGVVLTERAVDYAERVQSEREHQRSAAALITGCNKVQERLSKGEEIRDDGFFRARTGQPVPAQVVIDGVLTKARAQYEERKAILIGNLLANGTFDASLSADDLSWMLSTVDRLTFRHLLILAAFAEKVPSGWHSNNVGQIHTRSPVVFTQIEELRSAGLINGRASFAVDIDISPSGHLLVKATDLLEELKWYGDEVRRAISFPSE